MNNSQLLKSMYITEYTGPVLLIDQQQIIENVNRFRHAMPSIGINYAVKANPTPKIIQALIENGVSFDVASLVELETVLSASDMVSTNVDISKILYSNPVRSYAALKKSVACGVGMYVVDNETEIDKLKRAGAEACYIRLIVSNNNSTFPLMGKFGVSLNRAKELLVYCKNKGVDVKGITFHVGSQCAKIDNWINGIKLAKIMFAEMIDMGFTPDFLDLGGGFPIQYTDVVPTIEEIGEKINAEIADLVGYRIVAEPGRYLTANAGKMLCQVISTSMKDNKWIYLDVGVFHGMIEAWQTVADHHYTYATLDKNPTMVECTLAGPTCDSLDIITKSQMLPSSLESDDFLVVENCGVYTSAYGTNFNGFPAPKVIVI